ncbi:MAG: LolA family protein [Candidatus Acidiferrales bacterium]
MLKRWGWVVGIAMLCALPAAAQTNPSVDEIIAKNNTARGGLDKVKAMQSVRMSGRVLIGPGIEAPMTLEIKRPGQLRMEFTAQGMTGIQAYDGKGGWQVMPFTGSSTAEPLAGDDLKDVQEESDLDGPLVDYQTKGNKVELVDKEDVEGASCYKLKVTKKNGDLEYFYIDADSGLDIKEESKRTIQGTEQEVETSLGSYKEVSGLYFPFSIESGIKGTDQKQKVMIDKIEVNVPIEDARFAMPAPKPAATEPPAATKPPADAKPPLALMK